MRDNNEQMRDSNTQMRVTNAQMRDIKRANQNASCLALKSISYLLTVGMTVPISQGSHIGFTSGFLEWIVKILQVIILQEYA